MKSFSIWEALSYGWGKMKKEFSFVFLVTMIVWGVVFLSEGVFRFIDKKVTVPFTHSVSLVVVIVFTLVATIVMQAGFLKIFLKLHDEVDEEEPQLSDLYTYYPISWKLALGSIMQAFIVTVGFLLLLIPGFIFAVTYLFTKLIIVDKNVMPTKALMLSAQITKGIRMQLFKLALVLWALNLFGAFLVIGFLITLPVTMFTLVYVYRKLEAQTQRISETK